MKLNILESFKDLYLKSIYAKKNSCSSIMKQLLELFLLRRSGIGISDYYMYKLYDDSVFKSFKEKLTYRGWRFKDELLNFSHCQIQGIAFNKDILYRLLEDFALPCPKIIALYCATKEGFGRHQAMTQLKDLETYLKNEKILTFFGKPSNASHGYGAIGVVRKEEDQIILADKEIVSASVLAKRIHKISLETGTYMLTEYLEPAKHFKEICGSTLPSTRMVVLLRKGKPELFKCATLLPQDNRHVSNFLSGMNKSLSAGTDPESGILFNVLDSNLQHTERHPHSEFMVEGYKLPQWKEAKTMVLNAALAFSPFRMQHWDIAFSSRGPVILEMNFIGDMEPMQMHGPPGIFTEQFSSFYNTHKLKS